MQKSIQVSRELKLFLIAGGIIGLIGVAVFGIIHAVIIVPIWTRLLGGLPFGIGGGLAMGWALYELRAAGRGGATAWDGLTFGLLVWLTLVPMTAFGVLVRTAGMHSTNDSWEVALELLLAFATGALAGGVFGRRWRPALAVGATTLALTLAMGGPIPVTNSARAARLFAAFGGVYPFCGFALVFVKSMISRRLRSPA